MLKFKTLSYHYSTHRRKSQYFLCFFSIFAIISATILAIFTNCAPVSATSANDFFFSDFTADYYLSREADGTSRLKVVEQLTAVFPDTDQNHGITRVIPFTNNNGQNLTMASDRHLTLSVERNGQPEPWQQTEAGDGYFEVRIGDANEYVHGTQTYTLTYEFENLILDFDAGQELYWDANGNDWQQTFDRVTARVHLPDELAAAFDGRLACYVGRYGENDSSRCQIIDPTPAISSSASSTATQLADSDSTDHIIVFTAADLRARETLTFAVGFLPNTFVVPAPRTSYLLVIIAGIATAFAIALVVFIFKVRHSTADKRAYYKSLFIKPEYIPLAGVSVAELAEDYLGTGLKGNPKVATLLELAVSHKIELVKTETTGAFGRTKTLWKIHLKSLELTPEQTIVLQILNGSSTALTLDQEITVQNHTATSELERLAAKFDRTIKSSLEQKGLYEAKTQSQSGKGGALLALSVFWLIGCGCLALISLELPDEISYLVYCGAGWLSGYLGLLAIGLFVAGLIVSINALRFGARTRRGLEASRYLDGLHLYIKMAEADRLSLLQSVSGADTTHAGIVKLYERLLPYAALFGLEKSWLAELSKYYEFPDVSAPAWYIGVAAFSAHDFAAAVSTVTTAAGTSIAHSTASSSSSGGSGLSGGGGFSGGGGGGGGGGGW